jgi:Fis family transcriptional regulator
MINVMEKPLLDVVMRHAEGNQSRAAGWLGLNRNTLRKKLTEHKLL